MALISATSSTISKYTYLFYQNIRNISSTNYRYSFSKWYKNFWTPDKIGPPYNHVVQVGDPVLRQVSDRVPEELIKTKEIEYLVKSMQTVLRTNNCVGLAAPQIGIPLRVIVMEFNQKAFDKYTAEIRKIRDMKLLQFCVFINPEIKIKNFDRKIFPEGCASVQGYSAEVPRYSEVCLSGFNENGEKVIKEIVGWPARIAQHEMDHLDGKIYVDVMNTKTFTCTCWEAVNDKAGRVSIPFYPK